MSKIEKNETAGIIEISDRNAKKAHEIINELRIEDIWEKYSGKANLVGSVKTNLMMDHLDIDYHVYTKEFSIANSFSAIGEIAQSSKIKEVQYVNLLDYADKCLEWHLKYIDDENKIWQIDIMHIMNDSRYVGKFERVADRINDIMTKEMREKILRIKHDASKKKEKVIGIKVYRAVIEDNICNYEEFKVWEKRNRVEGIDEWEPE
jgi:hypothetical protein